MFHDAEYVKWANEHTIHVMSYSLDKNATKPEPLVDVSRDDGTVEALAAFPMFTPNEAEALVNEINAAVTFPTSTPWSGVISPADGKTVLAEIKNGTAKDFRALYDAEAKKLPAPLARETWKKSAAALAASTEAEFDEKFAAAVKLALEAKALVKEPTKAMAERLDARAAALEKIGRERLDAAMKEKDAVKRAKALGTIAADWKGMPAGDDAAKALAAK